MKRKAIMRRLTRIAALMVCVAVLLPYKTVIAEGEFVSPIIDWQEVLNLIGATFVRETSEYIEYDIPVGVCIEGVLAYDRPTAIYYEGDQPIYLTLDWKRLETYYDDEGRSVFKLIHANGTGLGGSTVMRDTTPFIRVWKQMQMIGDWAWDLSVASRLYPNVPMITIPKEWFGLHAPPQEPDPDELPDPDPLTGYHYTIEEYIRDHTYQIYENGLMSGNAPTLEANAARELAREYRTEYPYYYFADKYIILSKMPVLIGGNEWLFGRGWLGNMPYYVATIKRDDLLIEIDLQNDMYRVYSAEPKNKYSELRLAMYRGIGTVSIDGYKAALFNGMASQNALFFDDLMNSYGYVDFKNWIDYDNYMNGVYDLPGEPPPRPPPSPPPIEPTDPPVPSFPPPGELDGMDDFFDDMDGQLNEAVDNIDFNLDLSDFLPAIGFIVSLFMRMWDGLGSLRIIFMLPLLMGVALMFIGRAARENRMHAQTVAKQESRKTTKANRPVKQGKGGDG